MDLISAFHMDLDWIRIYKLVEMDYGLDLDYDVDSSCPTGYGSETD